MSDCTLHDPLIAQRYLDGELDHAAAAEFEAHAQTCSACHAMLAEWRDIGEAIRALPSAAWSPESTRALVRRARERQLQTTRRVAWGLLAAASFLLVSSLFLVGYSQAGQGDVPSIMAQWEEYVVAPPEVDDDLAEFESRTLVAIHVKAAAGENGNE